MPPPNPARWAAAPPNATSNPAPPGNAGITGAIPPGPGTVAAGQPWRGGGLRIVLIAVAAVVVLAAVVAALLALRAHRQAGLANQGSSTSARSGSTAAAPRTPVAGAAGAASTGPLPSGWHWYTATATKTGTYAGFTLAIPDGWQVSSRGQGYYFEAPGGDTFLQVDLTPHTNPTMLAEAKYLAALTQQQGKFPGYGGQSIRSVNIRNQPGAAWSFAWQDPTLGRVRALDLMYIAKTTTGKQSFALYMSSPGAAFNGNLATFTEEIRTFRPVP